MDVVEGKLPNRSALSPPPSRPGGGVLAVTPRGLVIRLHATLGIYGLYWVWQISKVADRVSPAKKTAHIPARWAVGSILLYWHFWVSALLLLLFVGEEILATPGPFIAFLAVGMAACNVGLVTGALALLRVGRALKSQQLKAGVAPPIDIAAYAIMLLIPLANVLAPFLFVHKVQTGFRELAALR